ncbi:MAG: DUF1343 domain-containing protein [Acidobacteriota bacterium]
MAAGGLVSCLSSTPFQTGADQLFEPPYFDWIRGRRVGLITNQTGVDSNLKLTADRLEAHPEVQLTAIFGPEHGFLGTAQAGGRIPSRGRVYSLYGENRAPAPEVLSDLDVLLYDIQDVGARYYTFISTLSECLRAAARQGIPFIVLDRPDPLGGLKVEGPVLEKGFESFVGVHNIPARYGMTPAEMAGLLNDELQLGADLKVVPLQAWQRRHWYDETGLQWISPSPNMPSLTTATVYPGFCLMEGTNLSEGRGTTRPFELLGAPWLQARRLAWQLNRLGLPGVRFRPQGFRPSFSKYSGQQCAGIQVHLTDRSSFEPLRTVLHVLREILQLHPQEFQFNHQAFDRLMGNSWVREELLRKTPVQQIVQQWQGGLAEFDRRRSKHLIYE